MVDKDQSSNVICLDDNAEWFRTESLRNMDNKTYQERFNAFRDAMAACLNKTAQPFATIRTKCLLEALAKEHGVNVSVSLTDSGVNVEILPETSVVCTLSQIPGEPLRSKSDDYDALLERLTACYGPKLGLFLTNRVAGMLRKHKVENPTHLRICEIGDPVSEGTYRDIEASGSYGSCSETFEFKPAWSDDATRIIQYKIGFNHGF